MNIYDSMCHHLKFVTIQIGKMSGNSNTTAVATPNAHTIDAMLSECRRLITLGQHPQIRNQLLDPSTGNARVGVSIELWSPQKKAHPH